MRRFLPPAVLLVCLPLAAQEFTPLVVPPAAAPPAGVGGDELALFSELPVVVTASHRASRIADAPVAISVVTADDLHYGGYDRFTEALHFVPGVDVAYSDRSHPMVGVRGLHETFSDRTLLLLDGQVAENPVYGGGELDRLPVLTADIDRIEIVRGPGGAAWGANAFNGVINVVSKAPEGTLGTLVSGGGNAHGDLDAQLRWGDFAGPLRWRLSLGGSQQVDAQTATGNDTASVNDESQRVVGSGALTWDCTATTIADMRIGYAHGERGSIELYTPPNAEPAINENLFGAFHLRQALADGVALDLGATTSYYASDEPTTLKYTSSEVGYSGQLDLTLAGGHQVSLGGDTRFTHLVTYDRGNPEDFVFTPSEISEYRLGAFIIDRWQISPRIATEGQLRSDTYAATGQDWAGRLALLTSVDEDHQHVLRCAVARAYRAPLSALRLASADRVPVPGLGPLVIYRTEPLSNEHTWSLELGWTSRVDGWSFQTETYYQHYEGLIGYANELIPLAPGVNQTAIIPRKLGNGAGYGVESEAGWTGRRSGMSLWYAWNGFATEHSDQSVRAFLPSEQNVGVRSRWLLATDLIGVVNYRYASVAVAQDGANYHVDAYHRLDLALTWQVWRGADLTGGCHDVLDDAPRATSVFTSPTPLPGRTFFLRGDWAF
jgi:outer membrane receptor for ferrienterochelin and colicin